MKLGCAVTIVETVQKHIKKQKNIKNSRKGTKQIQKYNRY